MFLLAVKKSESAFPVINNSSLTKIPSVLLFTVLVGQSAGLNFSTLIFQFGSEFLNVLPIVLISSIHLPEGKLTIWWRRDYRALPTADLACHYERRPTHADYLARLPSIMVCSGAPHPQPERICTTQGLPQSRPHLWRSQTASSPVSSS